VICLMIYMIGPLFGTNGFTNMNPGPGCLEVFDLGLGDPHLAYFFY
jgi:hypothetical protein